MVRNVYQMSMKKMKIKELHIVISNSISYIFQRKSISRSQGIETAYKTGSREIRTVTLRGLRIYL